MSRRDLYRYDQLCAEDGKGIRNRKLHHVQANDDIFTYTTRSVPGGASNATAWQNHLHKRVDVQRGDERTMRDLLSVNTIFSTYTEDNLMRARQAGSYGNPFSSVLNSLMSIRNLDTTIDWYQRTTASAFSMSDQEWITQTQCTNAACSNTKPIKSLYPIELTKGLSPSSTIYGTWVDFDRQTQTDAYRVQIGKRSSSLQNASFSVNILQSALRSSIKPTLACVSSMALCHLYYVPIEDAKSRIHLQFLMLNNNGELIAPFGVSGFPIKHEDSYIATGSNLTSWVRQGTDDKYYAYLAFASNDIGMPMKILKFAFGTAQSIDSATFGTVFSSPSISRYQPSGNIDLIWIGP